MLATKSWIYLDLEKTGSTFLRHILLSIFPQDDFMETRKHLPMENATNLPTIMTIRDPCEYYFSLWSYGLDKKGGFYKKLCQNFPDLACKAFQANSPSSFGAFLDFALHSPARYPNQPRKSWLPLCLDVYTVRILSMIVPLHCRYQFLEELGDDYPNSDRIIEAAKAYLPGTLLRTHQLNSDFHRLALDGKLNFLRLPLGWQKKFPITSSRINRSSQSQNDLLLPGAEIWLNLPGWKSAVEAKSSLALWMLQMATSRVEN